MVEPSVSARLVLGYVAGEREMGERAGGGAVVRVGSGVRGLSWYPELGGVRNAAGGEERIDV